MQNLLMLLIAAGGTSLCACTSQPQAHVEQTKAATTIVVRKPRGEPGDFVLCKDGSVLVFPAANPKNCSCRGKPALVEGVAFRLNFEAIMKKQIATATIVGATLALACLLWEQQSVAAYKGQATRATHAAPSPFDRHLRYAYDPSSETGLTS
jgi:hypothetical protein